MHSLNVIKNVKDLPKPRVSRCRGKQSEHKIRHLVKVSCHLHTVSTSLYVIPAVMQKIRSRVCLKRREKAAEVRLNP